MKKIFLSVTVIVMLVCLTACGEIKENAGTSDTAVNNESVTKAEPTTEKELYNMGLDIVSTMREMIKSDEYGKIVASRMSMSKDIVNTDDYDTPKAVYSVTPPSFDDLVSLVGSPDKSLLDGLSDNLKKQLKTRASFASLVSAINGSHGADEISISSIYTSQTELESLNIEDTVVYLYTFEKGTPVVVIFHKYGYATGHFSFIDDVKEYESFKCKLTEVSHE